MGRAWDLGVRFVGGWTVGGCGVVGGGGVDDNLCILSLHLMNAHSSHLAN